MHIHSLPRLGRRQLLGAFAVAGLGMRPAMARDWPVQRAAIAPALYEIAYSPSQKAVFVTSAGGFGEDAAPSKVFRLDPATLAVQAEIDLPHKGFGLVLHDATGRLYIGHSVDAAVSAIDIRTNKVVATTPPLAEKVRSPEGRERYPYGIRELLVDASGQRLYVPGLSPQGSVLWVFDAPALKLERTVPDLGPMATGITLDGGRNRLFLSNLRGELITLDTKDLSIAKRFAAGGAEQPLNIAYDADTNRVLVVDEGLVRMRENQVKTIPGFESRNPGNRLVAVDADTGTLVKEAPTGAGPVALRLDAPRRRVYVTSRGGGSVAVIDSATFEVVGTVPLPTHPNSLGMDEAGQMLFVTVKNGQDEPKTAKESVARIDVKAV